MVTGTEGLGLACPGGSSDVVHPVPDLALTEAEIEDTVD